MQGWTHTYIANGYLTKWTQQRCKSNSMERACLPWMVLGQCNHHILRINLNLYRLRYKNWLKMNHRSKYKLKSYQNFRRNNNIVTTLGSKYLKYFDTKRHDPWKKPIDKFNLSQIKNFCSLWQLRKWTKQGTKKHKQLHHMLGKIFANPTSNKGLDSRIHTRNSQTSIMRNKKPIFKKTGKIFE